MLDFSKAFDQVPYQRLICKLDHYGVLGPLLSWTQNFLTQRFQRVVMVATDGQSSDWVPVISGVPQGTVLGPLIFPVHVFINDLQTGITSKLRLFADDCLIYRSSSCINDSDIIQQDLNRLHQWSVDWQMQFNNKRCHIMKFTHRRKITNTQYQLGGDCLSSVSEYPYLEKIQRVQPCLSSISTTKRTVYPKCFKIYNGKP